MKATSSSKTSVTNYQLLVCFISQNTLIFINNEQCSEKLKSYIVVSYLGKFKTKNIINKGGIIYEKVLKMSCMFDKNLALLLISNFKE
jgi:hypothetical protein